LFPAISEKFNKDWLGTKYRRCNETTLTHVLLRTRCPSGYQTKSVEALKETQSTDPNQWHAFILPDS